MRLWCGPQQLPSPSAWVGTEGYKPRGLGVGAAGKDQVQREEESEKELPLGIFRPQPSAVAVLLGRL